MPSVWVDRVIETAGWRRLSRPPVRRWGIVTTLRCKVASMGDVETDALGG
jgi:hypothetical protein